jgi:hypothetical protein
VTTLDLHIGLHKTGTSTLQSFFVTNEAALKKHSVVYPRTMRKDNSHCAILTVSDADDSLKSVMAELHAECADFEHALISAEGLSNAFLDKGRLARFCDAAARHFHPRIIIYLRRQDELKSSIYGQVAREWYQGGILDENHYEYDHLKRLDILQSAVGKDDLIVRRYRREQKIEDDFLAIYGLSADQGFEPVAPENAALNRRITALVARLDKRELQHPERFHWYLANSGLFADDGHKHLWAPGERSAFLARFEASNREVAKRYFPKSNGELFEAPGGDEHWIPVSPSDEREMWRDLVARLWNDYVRAERRQIPTLSTVKKVYSRALRKFRRGRAR